MSDEQTFLGHLEELRRRIIVSLVAVGVASVACLPLSSHIIRLLKAPASGAVDKLVFFGPEEAFLIYMRVGFLAGLIIASPVVLYQFWAFVSPAVEERLKKYITAFAASSAVAFIAGCAFAYSILLPQGLKFLFSFASRDLEPVISANNYISFVVAIIVWTGIIFEMPVLSFILTRAGVLQPGILRKKFGVALIIICIIAAVITPTADAINMILLAAPMLVLYEISIWVSAFARRKVISSARPPSPFGSKAEVGLRRD